MKPCTGIKAAAIRIKRSARERTSGVVLYMRGNRAATGTMSAPMIRQLPTEKARSFVSVSRASSIFPAPRSCPTMIATAFPRAR